MTNRCVCFNVILSVDPAVVEEEIAEKTELFDMERRLTSNSIMDHTIKEGIEEEEEEEMEPAGVETKVE